MWRIVAVAGAAARKSAGLFLQWPYLGFAIADCQEMKNGQSVTLSADSMRNTGARFEATTSSRNMRWPGSKIRNPGS